MRQLVLIAVTVAALFYVTWTLQSTVVGAESAPSVGAMERALQATGAKLEGARLQGWMPAAQEDLQRIRRQLPPEASVSYVTGHVAVTWRPRVQEWAVAYGHLVQALGPQGRVSVQLEGQAVMGDPGELVERAMAALKTGQLQPWIGPQAASTAGVSPLLPTHGSGVNVQVAARRTGQGARIWVGWPLLYQEY